LYQTSEFKIRTETNDGTEHNDPIFKIKQAFTYQMSNKVEDSVSIFGHERLSVRTEIVESLETVNKRNSI
jgi:hypothetical protein